MGGAAGVAPEPSPCVRGRASGFKSSSPVESTPTSGERCTRSGPPPAKAANPISAGPTVLPAGTNSLPCAWSEPTARTSEPGDTAQSIRMRAAAAALAAAAACARVGWPAGDDCIAGDGSTGGGGSSTSACSRPTTASAPGGRGAPVRRRRHLARTAHRHDLQLTRTVAAAHCKAVLDGRWEGRVRPGGHEWLCENSAEGQEQRHLLVGQRLRLRENDGGGLGDAERHGGGRPYKFRICRAPVKTPFNFKK
eukprot:scaffold22148_cov101-Isochrysis_galbana.AAC.1